MNHFNKIACFALLLAIVTPAATAQTTKRTELDASLLRAIQSGQTRTVQTLLAEGANPSRADHASGTRPLLEGDKGATVSVKVSSWTGLMWAASGGYTDIVKLLLQHEAAVNEHDEYGKTALTIAAFSGHAEIVRLLLAHGANIEAHETISGGSTPLVLAAQNGHADTVRVLLAHHANPNAAGEYRQTALIWAIVGGHTEIVRMLLVAGADVNAKDGSGQTALAYAKKSPTLTTLLKTAPAK